MTNVVEPEQTVHYETELEEGEGKLECLLWIRASMFDGVPTIVSIQTPGGGTLSLVEAFARGFDIRYQHDVIRALCAGRSAPAYEDWQRARASG